MNPDLPSVSTFRVEKPGKSKFAPSIGGRKVAKESATATAATAASSTATTTAAVATPAEATAPTPLPTDAQIQTPPAAIDDDESLTTTDTPFETSQLTQSKSQGTRIESIASRRQVAKPESGHDAVCAPKLPDAPKNAASIATLASAGDSTTSTNAAVSKRTMAYFLKDAGVGREMPTSVSTSKGSNGRSTGRRIVNLKNIKASRSTTTALAPQVRVVDGKIVYDEEMAAVAAPAITDDIEDELEYVDEDDEHGKHLTSATYAKRSGSNRWNAEETEFFYEALAMCGTDFSMIQTFFPHRTRAQVKGKFKIEERADPNRVAQALKQRKPFDASLKDRINKRSE